MSLYAAYACNEGSGTTIIDYSGNSRNMTAVGSNTWPSPGHGSYANCFNSGASGSDGASWNGGSLLPALSGDITIMTWHLTNAGATTISFAAGLYGSPGFARLAMFSYRSLSGISAAPQLTVRDSAGNLYSMGVNSTTADALWHHVAAVYHAAGGVDMYVDGSSVGTFATGGNPIGTQVQYIAIGSSFSNTGAQSQVQDLRVFDQALVAADIVTYMNTPVTGGSGTVSGVTAPLALAAPAGAAQSNAVTISGPVAQLALAAPAGTAGTGARTRVPGMLPFSGPPYAGLPFTGPPYAELPFRKNS